MAPDLCSAKSLKEKKIDFSFIDGQRVSSEKVLKTAVKVFTDENNNLVELLNRNNINAISFIDNIFSCEISNDRLGFVGDVKGVEITKIKEAIRKGLIPVISPLGKTESMQHVNINADMATMALAKSIMPDKVIFLSSSFCFSSFTETFASQRKEPSCIFPSQIFR